MKPMSHKVSCVPQSWQQKSRGKPGALEGTLRSPSPRIPQPFGLNGEDHGHGWSVPESGGRTEEDSQKGRGGGHPPLPCSRFPASSNCPAPSLQLPLRLCCPQQGQGRGTEHLTTEILGEITQKWQDTVTPAGQKANKS